MATTAPRYTYLISRNLDPIFGIFIGVSAAYTRVTREEKEKGRSGRETLDGVRRRFDIALGREVQPLVDGAVALVGKDGGERTE